MLPFTQQRQEKSDLNATKKWNHSLGLYYIAHCGQQGTLEGTVSVTVLDLLSKFATPHFEYEMWLDLKVKFANAFTDYYRIAFYMMRIWIDL